jgi:surface polysaccharide O-acyltransferase-like enzyme
MSKETGRLWGKAAVVLLLLLPVIIIAGSLDGSLNAFGGGLTWQNAAYAFWEQLFCIAVSIGLTVWFREKFNTQTRLTKAMSESSYGAYLIQAPILVYLAIFLQGVEMPLMLKFAIISPFAVALCFGTAYLLRKIPKADYIL